MSARTGGFRALRMLNERRFESKDERHRITASSSTDL
jgi:hypothetical protein